MPEEERFEPRVDTRNCRRRCRSLNIVHNRREVDTVFNVMLAGMGTTSSALTWFIWPVSCHPRAENKIIEERQSIIPVDENQGRGSKEFGLSAWSIMRGSKVTYIHQFLGAQGTSKTRNMKILFNLLSMGRMKWI
ncbi:hypothetical protein V6N13_009768 [Hibiscus sabdariffa]|uniref:Uncharacterized protein n=1 Tax=Hibiscus sabdariffa TaxID=183260 RepID=A0ABR2B9X9_9ROSI